MELTLSRQFAVEKLETISAPLTDSQREALFTAAVVCVVVGAVFLGYGGVLLLLAL